MLSLYSQNSGRFCDGISRRGFLKVGGLSLGGASLPQMLSAESSSTSNPGGLGHKAVIMIFLAGGHLIRICGILKGMLHQTFEVSSIP